MSIVTRSREPHCTMISQCSALLCRNRFVTPSRSTVASVTFTSVGSWSHASMRTVTSMSAAVSNACADWVSSSNDSSR